VLYTDSYFAPGGPSTGTESLRLFDADDVEVPGVTRRVGDSALFFFPSDPFEPFATYTAVATGGFADLEFTFTTGSALDTEPPSPGAITRVSIDHVGSSCSAPSGGYRVSVSFTAATDDGALGSMEYLLYLTRGPGVAAPARVARLRHFATSDELTMGFVLGEAQSDSIVCVSLRVEDGEGRASSAGGACFDPVTGAFFQPLCSVGAPGAGSPRPLALLPFALSVLVLGVRRLRR
jgi:hypothetical protein